MPISMTLSFFRVFSINRQTRRGYRMTSTTSTVELTETTIKRYLCRHIHTSGRPLRLACPAR